MENPQIVVDAAVSGIDPVEFGSGVVWRARALTAFAGLVGGRGGNQSDAAGAERLGQRLKWHFGVMRPAIRRGITERQIILADPLQYRGSAHLLQEQTRSRAPLGSSDPSLVTERSTAEADRGWKSTSGLLGEVRGLQYRTGSGVLQRQ